MNILGHQLFPVTFFDKACFVVEGSFNPTGGVKGGICYLQILNTGTGIYTVKLKNIIRDTSLSPSIEDGNFDFSYQNIISVENGILFNSFPDNTNLPMEVYTEIDLLNNQIILYTVHRDTGLTNIPAGSYLQCRVFSYLNVGGV